MTQQQPIVTMGPGGKTGIGADPSPRVVGSGRGWDWIVEGFGYFRRAPGAWIGMVLVWFLIALALNFVPMLGPLAFTVLSPVFMAGFMLACRKQEQGGAPAVGDLFEGYSRQFSALAATGALYLAGLVLVSLTAMLTMMAMGGAAVGLEMIGGGGGLATLGMGMLLTLLVVLGLSVPLIMALWFAPALVVLDGVAPVEAMKLSFRGCLLNIGPFLVYGLIGLVVSFIAAIPLMLGFLVWVPVLVISAYTGYRDVFDRHEAH